ncbi:MAG: cupin domain-containing protein [Oscillospiraceae bacterium]|jgi:mannose-6-phosphate isomerase-like protein (cupin superfamily)|nr:cupin domain-containing protein [Oscillospiraceae bacterium]
MNHLHPVNLLALANSAKLGKYISAGHLNGHMLNVLQVSNRTLDFHIHEKSDELFYVIEGTFEIETDDGLTEVKQGEIIIIPKGRRHRPVVKETVKCLLIELDGTLTAENTGGTY